MRSALISLLGGLATAVLVLAMPASALAADVPFYYGGIGGDKPLLPCTGFFNIKQEVKYVDPQGPVDNPATPQDERRYITENVNFQPVSNKATNNLPQCESLCDVFELVNNLLRFAISVLVTIFTPIMIIIGGFYVIFSGGNPGNRATGKKIITGTLVGLAIAICSALIVSQFMTFIFEREWGQAIKDQIRAQPDTGIKAADIPNFGWNTISCRPTSGSVQVNTSITNSSGSSGGNTGSGTGNGTGTGTNGSVLVALPAHCYTRADLSSYSCNLGWTDVGPPICPADHPVACRMMADNTSCYREASTQANGHILCNGTWTRTSQCSADAQKPFQCVRGSGTQSAQAGSCYTRAELSSYSCNLGWADVGPPICPADHPVACRKMADNTSCYQEASTRAGGHVICNGTWTRTSQCSADAQKPFQCVRAGTQSSAQSATPGSCYSDAEKSARTCALGWIRPTGGLHCLPDKPNYCRMQAAAGTCYPPNAIDQNSYECSGTWTTTARCRASYGQNTGYKECVTERDPNAPIQTGPGDAPPSAACSQAGGNACVSSATCERTGTLIGAPDTLGCTNQRFCCRQNTR